MTGRKLRVRCREIVEADLNVVVDLLLKSGFARSRTFWMRGLRRMSEHPTPPGFPRYGVILEVNEMPVGVLLMICTALDDSGDPTPAKIRCNFSSWFVWPGFRNFAPMLVAYAARNKAATYFNISPLPHTWPILEAQGFARYSTGRFVTLPAVKPGPRGVKVRQAAVTDPFSGLSPWQRALMRSHLGYGCLGLVVSAGGRHYPFLFDTSWKHRLARVAYLVYCPSIEDFVRFAGPIGRFLLRRGLPVVVVDATGPIRGLPGRYYNATPKFFKGPDRPRLGDLAYSEQMMLGFIA